MADTKERNEQEAAALATVVMSRDKSHMRSTILVAYWVGWPYSCGRESTVPFSLKTIVWTRIDCSVFSEYASVFDEYVFVWTGP